MTRAERQAKQKQALEYKFKKVQKGLMLTLIHQIGNELLQNLEKTVQSGIIPESWIRENGDLRTVKAVTDSYFRSRPFKAEDTPTHLECENINLFLNGIPVEKLMPSKKEEFIDQPKTDDPLKSPIKSISDDQNTIVLENGFVFKAIHDENRSCSTCHFKGELFCSQVPCVSSERKDGDEVIFERFGVEVQKQSRNE